MPKGYFTDPRSYGSDKPVKVYATKRMVYKGETKMPKDIFEVPEWQAKWWMTFPDSGIKIIGGRRKSSPPQPEARNDSSTIIEVDKSRTKPKARVKRRRR